LPLSQGKIKLCYNQLMNLEVSPKRTLKINSWLIPGLAALLIVLQVFFPFKGWVILASGFGGMTALAFLWVWRLKDHLHMEREMRFGWMQVGDHIQERLSLENDSRFPAIWVRIIDHSQMPGYAVDRIASVRSQWYTHWFTKGICHRRGIFTLGPTSVETGDPLGIFRVQIDYSQTVTMMVVPPVVPLPRIEIAPGGRTGEGQSTYRGLERTIVAGGVREYTPGDSLRWIHWPTTARTGEPYVRMFDYSPSSSWWVLLDMDPAVQVGEGEDSSEEIGVILAASLVHQGLQNGKQVGLVTHGEKLIWHPPDEGESHLWTVLRSLAVVRPKGPSLSEVLDHLRSTLAQRTSLIIITANAHPAWLDKLGYLLRRGIVPTVLLVNPAAFGGSQTPELLEENILDMGIKYYLINDLLQDLPGRKADGQRIQPGERLRQYSRGLNQQTFSWRTLG